MERTKYILIAILLFFSVNGLNASYKSEIYDAYIGNNMDGWKHTIDKMHLQTNKSDEMMLELINFQYGYIGWCIGCDKKDEAKKYLNLAEKNIELLEKKSFRPSYINSYKAAFYGFRIKLSPVKAPVIGPKSIECAKLAIKQDVANPFGHIQYGNTQLYMPAAFGGSKKVAIDHFLKAQKIMESRQDEIKEDWNYISLLTIIGKAYEETRNYKVAKQYYDKILKIEPEFMWIKKEVER